MMNWYGGGEDDGHGLEGPVNRSFNEGGNSGEDRDMSEWQTCAVSDSFVKNKVGRQNQIPAKDIAKVGRFPVVDQGREFVAGYCDDESRVIDFDLPLIIFGDHTRCFKYVDFPFVLGADGTKVLLPNKELYDPKFYYFTMLSLELPSRGYNRHFKVLKERNLPLPPPPEQKKIAHILSVVQRAIEAQERIIQTTTELKKALMDKLFTEGLRNESQKQTEIGPVPESWEVVELGTFFQIKHGFAFDGKFFKPSGDYILMTPGHFYEEGGFRGQGEKTKYFTGEIPKDYVLAKDDLVVAMTEQKSGLLGSAAFVPEAGRYLHNQRLGLIVDLDAERLSKNFLFNVFNLPHLRVEVAKTSTGSKVKHTSPTKLRAVKVGIPPTLEEQEEIATAISATEQKIGVETNKKTQLQDLFRTLLHELMTAKIRTN
ncbi:MAG: restriction endonuclease subunit S [Candidatus Marinimicrobia bacterium]|nr:restriction endonuclease subunit S [Candidatus Neomarinimicrobiota bacterium]MCF7904282.1 restriction endonuclease subunit S [Candidatus Neomarinimicrobiota bacterium]